MSGGGTMVVHTAVLEGLEARIVDVEAKATGGLGLRIEGPEMQKARALEKRVLHATTSCGMGIEGVSCRVGVQESGLTQMAGTTLAVAAACLAASGEISAGELSHCLFVGDVD